ncbi:GNAT family N-acetyltransferase [Nocardia sp. NPDC050718]|uniref:GNAT family N-acetyltransferase n=1 Tax=Nocardia sp. NPDC050718 TaxID=3155788 RepID=UPI0033FB5CDA
MDTEYPPALPPGIVPPDRVLVGDLVIRRWQAEDLDAKFAAINASFEQLHHWMEWAAEPPDFDDVAANHANLSAWPTPDGGFNYGVFDRAGSLLGVVGLHDRVGPATLEIGYWCHTEHVGRGVITRAAGALTTIALTLPGIHRIEIHCDAANLRSAAVARRIGYRLASTGPRVVSTPGESGRGMLWVMDRSAHRGPTVAG